VRDRAGWTSFLSGAVLAFLFGWLLLPGILYQSLEQPLTFSHAVHAGEEMGLACEDCHVFLPDGSFAGIPPIETCAGCHEEAISESEAEKTLVSTYVKDNRPVPWLCYARQPDHVHFSHALHVRVAKLACQSCHGEHARTTQLRPLERNLLSGYSRDIWGSPRAPAGRRGIGMKMTDCSACHRERLVSESCLDCHK
jgi:hypothetical protein